MSIRVVGKRTQRLIGRLTTLVIDNLATVNRKAKTESSEKGKSSCLTGDGEFWSPLPDVKTPSRKFELWAISNRSN